MAAVTLWSIGRHQTAFTLVGQQVDSAGTITDATGAPASNPNATQSLLGMWDEIDVDNDPETEEISAADAARQHNVLLKDAYKARFVQIARKAKAAGETATLKTNPLLYLVNNFDILKLTLTNGADTWTGYILRGSVNVQYRKGKTIATLSGLAVDTGAAMGYSTT